MRLRLAIVGRIGAILLLGAVALSACSVGDSDEETPTATAAPTRAIGTGARWFSESSSNAAPGAMASPAATGQAPMDAVAVVQMVGPAVVTVINEQRAGGFGSDEAQAVGAGTGFIINTEGHIVTNWHVVQGGDAFEVIFADGTERDAELVGSDEISDLAIVKVDGDVPATVVLGDSDLLQPGQSVLAIGSPLGSFTNTVTQGIVSALGRDIPEETGPQFALTGLIQHDAAINPGNSGGPLFNMAGEVVGVNTLGIPTVPGEDIPAQGLFFAIPSNTVKEIATKLIEEGEVVYPFFGVQTVAINEQIASQYDLPVDYGVFVQEVTPSGPADDAGVQQGDIVLAIDGERIDEHSTFTEVLFAHEPGETVTATVQRGSDEIEVEITLGERPR